MIVYRKQTYLPMRKCKKGHKRTEKNTRWLTYTILGKYTYRTARCIRCEREEYSARYARRKRIQELHARKSPAPGSPDAGLQPGSKRVYLFGLADPGGGKYPHP